MNILKETHCIFYSLSMGGGVGVGVGCVGWSGGRACIVPRYHPTITTTATTTIKITILLMILIMIEITIIQNLFLTIYIYSYQLFTLDITMVVKHAPTLRTTLTTNKRTNSQPSTTNKQGSGMMIKVWLPVCPLCHLLQGPAKSHESRRGL